MNMIRSETTQVKLRKALGKNNYHWVLGPGNEFLPGAGGGRAVGPGQRGVWRRGRAQAWAQQGSVVEALWAFSSHASSSTSTVLWPGKRVCNTSSVSGATATDYWITMNASTSWRRIVFCLRGLTSLSSLGHAHLTASPTSAALSYCAGPGGALSITTFFILYSKSRQNSQYWLQVPTPSLLRNTSAVITICLSPHSSWTPSACGSSVRAGCFVKWLKFVGFFLVWGLLC